MKKYFYALFAGILYAVFGMAQIPINKVLNSPENGPKLHQAYLTISFGKGYSFYTNGSTLRAQITNPTVGDMLYQNAVDPATYAINTSLPVKTLNEQLEVNGTFNYSVNFEVPNGAGGLQPTLGLNYMSGFTDGLLGTGFNISGLSSIDRVNKTIYHDGASLAIAGSLNDAYSLDGKRMLLNTGTYGMAGSTYGTELEEFSKIVAVGSSGSNEGPQSFVVYTKSGLIMEYGSSTDSCVVRSGTTVLSWKLKKISDRFNNTVVYSYFEYDDEKPICMISYNGGAAQIKFQYKQRTDKSNYVYGGKEFTRNILLEKIEMANNGLLFKKYEFNYMLDNCTKLLKITERSSTEQLMNPTVFSWTKQTEQYSRSSDRTWFTSDKRYFHGDFNGDGITDFVTVPIKSSYQLSDHWKLYIGSTNGNYSMVSEGQLLPGFITFITGDFDGDGLTDLVRKVDSYGIRLQNFRSTGSNFVSTGNEIGLAYSYTVISPSDYNGDGILEIFACIPDYNTNQYRYDLYNNLGTQLKYSILNKTSFFNPTIITNFNPDMILDFNGDNRSDFICLYTTGYELFELRNDLNKSSVSPNTTFNNSNDLRYGDFNGDGKTDILKLIKDVNGIPTWSVAYYINNGFTEYPISGLSNFNMLPANNQWNVTDLNGDGKDDIVIWGKGESTSNSSTYIFHAINKGNGYEFVVGGFSTGVTFDPLTTSGTPYYYFADYNGDGRNEMFHLSSNGNVTNYFTFATGTPSNLMNTIINGNGAKTTVDYLPMTNTSVHTKGSGATYPLIDLGAPIQLVSSVVNDNGTASATTITYSYNGAKAHLQGKGFLGFTQTKAVNGASGVTTESNFTFETTNFYPQISTVVNKKGTTLLSTNSYIWDKQLISGKRIFPFIKKHTQVNNLTNQTVFTDYSYFDTYGNLKNVKTDYGGGQTKELVYKYENELPTPNYLVGRPTTVDENYVRDGVTNSKIVVRIFQSTSNAVETETYNEGDVAGWTLTREFDNWGNVKKESRSATGIATQVTEFTYDAPGVNLGKVKDVNLAYETNFTYYPSNGLLYEKTDPFGNKITHTYNNADQLYTVTPTTGVTKTFSRSYIITGGPSNARFYVSETGNDNTTVKVWFDKTGKDIRNETKGFSGSMLKTDKVYFSSGLLEKYSEPTTGALANWNTYGYSPVNNRLSTFTPKYGPAESYGYSSAEVTKTVNGRQYKTIYNNDGTILQNQDPGGTLSFAYWPDGLLKSTTTSEGPVTSMVYDKNGNRLTMNDPSAGTITNQWYGTGQAKLMVVGGKLTTYYYQANGLLDYEIADGQTTDYTYNIKNQLSNISSPGGVSRSYDYYPNGALKTITESIGGVSNTVLLEYDSYGHLYKKTFNTSDYEQHEYQNGYLYKITFNGTTVWQATTIDEYSRISAANIGATAATWSYNTTTNMLSQIKGTGVQQYDYSFSGATGNLDSRTNGLKSETFGYDTGNLDRLISVTGTPPQTINYDPTVKGNITYKTDAGNYTYDPTRKYAVQNITNGLNISTTPQNIVYNVFNKVQTITEGTKTADFVYNADRQRIRMTLKTSGATTKTRYYFGGSCEREVVGSTTTQYIWIGGDAYTAVAVAKKIGTGSWAVYNIFRDHLGTITHLKNGTNPADEYSFDAWGRRRDKDDWSYTLTSEPVLFADRGFTAHEFLSDFNLYNMNGRLYDPVVGRFLSPDPFVQAPGFTQSYNRYSYCLNNPLKFTDYSGEKLNWPKFTWFHAIPIIGQFDYMMQMVNDNTPQLRQNMVNAKVPNFGVNYNTTFGTGFSFGDNPAYYPGYENRIVEGQRNISNQIAGFSGLGRDIGHLFSDHIFFEMEIRIDKGLQAKLEVEAFGGSLGGGFENNTEPIAQLNFGYENVFYGQGYSFDDPSYGYGGVIDPIRNGWDASYVAGASKSYNSRRGIFNFGNLESETIHWGVVNISGAYDSRGNIVNSKYFWSYGFDLSLIYGINFNLNFGYKHFHK